MKHPVSSLFKLVAAVRQEERARFRNAIYRAKIAFEGDMRLQRFTNVANLLDELEKAIDPNLESEYGEKDGEE